MYEKVQKPSSQHSSTSSQHSTTSFGPITFPVQRKAKKADPQSKGSYSIPAPRCNAGQPGDKYEQEADTVARQVVQKIHHAPMPTQNMDMSQPKSSVVQRMKAKGVQQRHRHQQTGIQTKKTNLLRRSADISQNAAGGEVIQAKFGMEYEFTKNKCMAKDRKDVLYVGTKWKLEVDSGHNLEFVTDPLDSEQDLVVALYEMIQLVNQMKEGAQKIENGYVFRPPGEGKNGWRVGEEAPITIEDMSFQSRAQVTEGVPMKNIPNLIQSFLGENERYGELMKVIAENENSEITPKVKGLVSAVEMYIYAMKGKQPDTGEGPKTMFTLMARSNFKAMHDRLNPEEREEFYRVIGLEGDTLKPENLLTKKLGVKPGDELYHKWTHNYNKGQVVK